MDLGSSVCSLDGVGAAHHFHTKNLDPRCRLERDDPYTATIDWPNFHSGVNGDFQQIEVVGDAHPVLVDVSSPTGAIRFLPSHAHEGAVSAPEGLNARVIARGRSKVTGKRFNLAVAFEGSRETGRAIAESSFHHSRTTTGIPAAAVRASSQSLRALRCCVTPQPSLRCIGMSGMSRHGLPAVERDGGGERLVPKRSPPKSHVRRLLAVTNTTAVFFNASLVSSRTINETGARSVRKATSTSLDMKYGVST